MRTLRYVAVAAVLVVGNRCVAGSEGTSVAFASPKDGAHVTSPVKIEMKATGVTIEPAGRIRENAGHFHVIADRGCVEPGLPIETTRAGYAHLGAGEHTVQLVLSSGTHRLCLQLGDGAHVALDDTDEITITVK